jgi:hypothetical protein
VSGFSGTERMTRSPQVRAAACGGLLGKGSPRIARYTEMY